MQRGDHLISPRTGYSHHGLYLGKNQVIHYTGFSDGRRKGTIAITPLEVFCQGEGFTIQTYPFRLYDHEESAQRALSRLGEDWYDILLNNCEHFVSWCILGVHHSYQTHPAIIGAAASNVFPKGLSKPMPQQRTAMHVKEAMDASVILAKEHRPGSVLPVGMGKHAPVARMMATSGLQLAATLLVGCALSYGAKRLADWFESGASQ